MQSENKIFDDIARVAGGAASALGSLKDQIRSEIRHRVDSVIANMDLVRREEFEAISAMAAKARSEQEEMEKRLAAIEVKLGIKKPAAKKTAAGKTTAKKLAAINASTKKRTAKKTTSKKPAASKTAAKKAAPKKTASSKTKSAAAGKSTKRSKA